jgi:hypothetical protein
MSSTYAKYLKELDPASGPIRCINNCGVVDGAECTTCGWDRTPDTHYECQGTRIRYRKGQGYRQYYGSSGSWSEPFGEGDDRYPSPFWDKLSHTTGKVEVEAAVKPCNACWMLSYEKSLKLVEDDEDIQSKIYLKLASKCNHSFWERRFND